MEDTKADVPGMVSNRRRMGQSQGGARSGKVGVGVEWATSECFWEEWLCGVFVACDLTTCRSWKYGLSKLIVERKALRISVFCVFDVAVLAAVSQCLSTQG